MANENLITWDESENRVYEYGVSNGVLYTKGTPATTGGSPYVNAEAWNGLINITDSPSGADNTKLWADGIEYAAMRAAEQYGGSIEAYTFPDGFYACDGFASPIEGLTASQQEREVFGLCWRTEIGNADDQTAGYKLHLAYGLTASPSEKAHDTVNDSPDAATMSWDFEGTPVKFTGYKPTCKLVVDSRKFTDAQMKDLTDALYGVPATTGTSATAEKPAYLPLPDEVVTLLGGVNDDD